jgi:hypothetical protein
MSNNLYVWRPYALGGAESMLEWRPRLIVLLVALVIIAALLADVSPLNIGWAFY